MLAKSRQLLLPSTPRRPPSISFWGGRILPWRWLRIIWQGRKSKRNLPIQAVFTGPPSLLLHWFTNLHLRGCSHVNVLTEIDIWWLYWKCRHSWARPGIWLSCKVRIWQGSESRWGMRYPMLWSIPGAKKPTSSMNMVWRWPARKWHGFSSIHAFTEQNRARSQQYKFRGGKYNLLFFPSLLVAKEGVCFTPFWI